MRAGASLATLTALFALAACGGGGTSATPPLPPPPPGVAPAVLSVSLAGGAGPNVDHMWVTVTGVAINKDASRPFGDGDPSWVVETLEQPSISPAASSPRATSSRCSSRTSPRSALTRSFA